MTDIRLCVECVHFLGEGDDSKCERTRIEVPDLIYGKNNYRYMTCMRERSGRCGPEGKYWEPRK